MVGQLHTTKSWNQITDDLLDELRKWDVSRRDVILPTMAATVESENVVVEFLFKGEWRTVECSKFSGQIRGAHRNLLAISLAVRATRMADQRGIASILAQVSHLLALPDPNDPYVILGIAPTKDLDAMKKAYRARIMEVHPDRGGDRKEFDRVRKAAETLGII